MGYWKTLIGKGGKKIVETVSDTVETVSDNSKHVKTQNSEQASERHKNDMLSDSWLSKNVRPLVLLYVVGLFTAFAIMDYVHLGFIRDYYVKLLETIFMYAIPFYFGGRFLEKIVQRRWRK